MLITRYHYRWKIASGSMTVYRQSKQSPIALRQSGCHMSAVTYLLLLLQCDLRVRPPRDELVYCYLYAYMTSGHTAMARKSALRLARHWASVQGVIRHEEEHVLILSTGRRPGDKYSCLSVRLHGANACEGMSQRRSHRGFAHDLSIITTLPPNRPSGHRNPAATPVNAA